jgi:hypothetical protein
MIAANFEKRMPQLESYQSGRPNMKQREQGKAPYGRQIKRKGTWAGSSFTVSRRSFGGHIVSLGILDHIWGDWAKQHWPANHIITEP